MTPKQSEKPNDELQQPSNTFDLSDEQQRKLREFLSDVYEQMSQDAPQELNASREGSESR